MGIDLAVLKAKETFYKVKQKVELCQCRKQIIIATIVGLVLGLVIGG